MTRCSAVSTITTIAVVAVLTGFAASTAQESSPEAEGPIDPISATAEALGVSGDCVVEAFGDVRLGSPIASLGIGTPTASLPVEAEVTLIDLAYVPCAVTFPADTPSTLTLTNEYGAAIGNVVIDALNIRSENAAPGEEVDIVIDAPAGVYVFYSDVPGQRAAGRAGILVVQGAATPVAGVAEASK